MQIHVKQHNKKNEKNKMWKNNSFIETTVKSWTHVKNKMNKKKIIFQHKNN